MITNKRNVDCIIETYLVTSEQFCLHYGNKAFKFSPIIRNYLSLHFVLARVDFAFYFRINIYLFVFIKFIWKFILSCYFILLKQFPRTIKLNVQIYSASLHLPPRCSNKFKQSLFLSKANFMKRNKNLLTFYVVN